MDLFIEKLVTKKKTPQDSLITVGIVLGIIILTIVTLPYTRSFAVFVIAALGYLGYYLITARNIEFEYCVTNGDLDIDKIISQRRRKRIFSGHCKEFEIVARVNDTEHNREIHNINNKVRIEAVSTLNSPDVYFTVTTYKGARTIIFFEPNSRMLESFKLFIPRKVFE